MRKSQYKNYLVFVICFINIYSSSNLIAQRIYTVAGGSLGDNLPASQVGLTVWSIAVDEDGNIYVADSGNGRVRKIDSSTGLIGGFDGPGRTVLAMDKLGYLYMSDYYENTIKKFDLTSGELLIIAGNGTEGYSGDGSLALNAQLSKPTGIAIDKDGNVYISDTGNSRIRRVDGITQIITTIAGTGSSGFSGDGNLAINAQFNEPEGLAADSQGNIYIADKYNNRIRKVSISSGLISTVAGNGSVFPYLNDELAINTNLSNPSCIAVDIEDNLYIADFWHSCVFKVFSSNGRIALVAGNGTYGISGDGGLAVNASLLTPNSLGFDKFGNIYFGDLSTVRKVEVSSGLITTITGNGSHSYCCDGGPAIEAQFSVLNGIAIDDHGNIYIADTDNFRVRKVDENGIITTFAGIGQLGFGDEENGGLAINAKLSPPIGITTDHVGNVYISEAFRIRKVDVTTGIITTFAGTGVSGFSGDGGLAINAKINAQAGIEFDSYGDLFFVDGDNKRVRKVSLTTGIITTIAGGGLNGDGSHALDAELTLPLDIAFDSRGNLFISEQFRVRKVDAISGIITTIAGDGTSGFTGDNGLAVNSKLSYAYGIAINSIDEIYISDGSNARVRKIDNDGIITTVAGNGMLGVSGDWGLATEAMIGVPLGITIDKNDDVYFNASSRVRKIQISKNEQTITFETLSNKTYGDAHFELSATASSGLPISYFSSDETIAAVSGSTVTIVGAGSVTFTASQEGNADFNFAPDVTQILTINKASQLITFNSLPTRTLGNAPFSLSASASSNLSIQYTTNSDKISLSGDQATLVKAGIVTIKADQNGNNNFESATSVSQSFCINPAKPIIVITGLNSGSPILTSSSSVGNQWYRNGALIENAISNTFNPTIDGSYALKISVDNCSSELSDEQVLVITGDLNPTIVSDFIVYPNPVTHDLTVNLFAFDSNADVEIIIYDSFGKMIEKSRKRGDIALISVSSYSRGVYFIKATQFNNHFVAKFIKE